MILNFYYFHSKKIYFLLYYLRKIQKFKLGSWFRSEIEYRFRSESCDPDSDLGLDPDSELNLYPSLNLSLDLDLDLSLYPGLDLSLNPDSDLT